MSTAITTLGMPPPVPAFVLRSMEPANVAPVPRSAVISKFARRQREMLWIAGIVIVMSYALRVVGDRVALAWFPQWPFPETCGARAWFGVTCPGCGLTRSFVYLAHGHWLAAYHCHRLGWLLALMTIVQIPYRLFTLNWGEILSVHEKRWISRVLIFSLISNWLLQIAGL